MVVIRRASKDYPLGGRDTGSIDTSTFSMPWLLILMSLLFAFQPPTLITRLSFPAIWFILYVSKVVLPIQYDIVTVSCNLHVIATSRLSCPSCFFPAGTTAPIRFLPSSSRFRQFWWWSTSHLVIDHSTKHKSLPVTSLVNLSASLKVVTARRKSRPQKCSSLKCDVTAF